MFGAFSFVNAQNCEYSGSVDAHVCNPWEYCDQSNCLCELSGPWFVTSWNVCGVSCSYDSGLDAYACNPWEYCNQSNCLCWAWWNISNWMVCSPYVAYCTDPWWNTINSWEPITLFQHPTVPSGSSCVPQTFTCQNVWWVWVFYPFNPSWYSQTCIVSWSVSTWLSCVLWWLSYPHWTIKTGFSNSCGSCTLNSITCNDGSWTASTWNVAYSSCSPSCSTSGGGSSWWWGGSSTPTCNFVDLVCVNWTYQKKPGVNCINWNVGNACSGTWISVTTGNVATGTWLNPWKYDRIWDISNSPYSKELNLAYLYAYNMWVTTMPNIFKADLEWKLIRSHMAKMMVQWSKKVLGVKANTGINCKFDDISYLKGQDLYEFVIQACQMWLMGVDNTWKPKTSFDPDGVVTRAQFGTVLSRAIRWEYYNGWDPFYNYHLEALNSVGIMKKISKPWDYELRGWVMLMLHRSHVMLSK